MMDIKMIKKGDVLCFDGIVQYQISETKEVVIDGEIYANTSYKSITKTINELRRDLPDFWFQNYEYCFEEINENILIEDCSYFTRSFADGYITHFSDNEYVQRIMVAFSEGLLSKKIKNVYTQKISEGYKYSKYDSMDADYLTLDRMEVEFLIHSYGFNNGLFYSVSLQDFFEIPVENIPKDIVKYFRNSLGVSLTNKAKPIDALKLLIEKIKHETRKQQKYGRISV